MIYSFISFSNHYPYNQRADKSVLKRVVDCMIRPAEPLTTSYRQTNRKISLTWSLVYNNWTTLHWSYSIRRKFVEICAAIVWLGGVGVRAFDLRLEIAGKISVAALSSAT